MPERITDNENGWNLPKIDPDLGLLELQDSPQLRNHYATKCLEACPTEKAIQDAVTPLVEAFPKAMQPDIIARLVAPDVIRKIDTTLHEKLTRIFSAGELQVLAGLLSVPGGEELLVKYGSYALDIAEVLAGAMTSELDDLANETGT